MNLTFGLVGIKNNEIIITLNLWIYRSLVITILNFSPMLYKDTVFLMYNVFESCNKNKILILSNEFKSKERWKYISENKIL